MRVLSFVLEGMIELVGRGLEGWCSGCGVVVLKIFVWVSEWMWVCRRICCIVNNVFEIV